MNDKQIQQMVNKFLGWKLPEGFQPDAGISFTPPENKVWWPTGTNLLSATQAEQMIRYMVNDMLVISPEDDTNVTSNAPRKGVDTE